MFDKRGVCLTELMVSLTAGVIVLAAALNALNVAQAHVSKQHNDLRHQQDLRLGLEVFEQEVRLAVADSIVSATPDEFRFHANISAHRTVTTGAVVSGQSVIAVQDGSGWSEGKTVIICGHQACETHRLSRSGQRYQLTLAEPVALSFPAGASVEVSNRVVYYTKRDENGTVKLMRMVDGGASILIGDLDRSAFFVLGRAWSCHAAAFAREASRARNRVESLPASNDAGGEPSIIGVKTCCISISKIVSRGLRFWGP